MNQPSCRLLGIQWLPNNTKHGKTKAPLYFPVLEALALDLLGADSCDARACSIDW